MDTITTQLPLEWNLSHLYQDSEKWKTSLTSISPDFKEILSLRDNLSTPEAIARFYDLYFKTEEELARLYTYAHLWHDLEITNPEAKTGFHQIYQLLTCFREACSFFEPQALSLPEPFLYSLLEDPALKKYHKQIDMLIKQKKHTLSAEEEKLCATASKALGGFGKVFRNLNDADFVFNPVYDEKGEKHPLSQASYHLYLKSQDRTLRESAFKTMHAKYQEHINCLAETLQGNTESHWFFAETHHFDSSLEASLFPHQIPKQVYFNLIDATAKNIDALHKYTALKKSVLGLDKMHTYDLYAPIIKTEDSPYPYEKGVDLVLTSLKPLGDRYCSILEKGLKEEGWVDVYEKKNKRSGAYSSGTYKTPPYILMNFMPRLRDVYTLAHEAGHSMHTYLSSEKQPYHLYDYPIFLAEIASTVNEQLLYDYLINQTDNDAEKATLISEHLEDLRATYYRQTLFAEFELFFHEKVEKSLPLIPEEMNAYYGELCQKYYGPSLEVEPIGQVEWARIPHFYANYYVYQYATGISIALMVKDRLLKDANYQEKYLDFLSSGGSAYPLELLKKLDISLESNAVFDHFSSHFREQTALLEKLLEKLKLSNES